MVRRNGRYAEDGAADSSVQRCLSATPLRGQHGDAALRGAAGEPGAGYKADLINHGDGLFSGRALRKWHDVQVSGAEAKSALRDARAQSRAAGGGGQAGALIAAARAAFAAPIAARTKGYP